MDNVFNRFNRDFFRSVKGITWYDKEGIMEMDDNRRIVFKLDDVGTRDHFVGYWVRIYTKTNGLIVEKFFRFQFCLDYTHRDRQEYYHVWYNGGKLDWYISRPKSLKPMVDMMMDYVDRWK